MEGKVYGYIRVSTKEQNEDRQLLAMREFGVKEDMIVIDKQSGKDFDRPGYKWLMKKMRPGDSLVIKSIDRLGRNYDEILEQWRFITKEKRAAITDRYAAFRYKTGQGPYRDADRGYCTSAPQLCRPDGERIHTPASGGRNRCREKSRSHLWQETAGTTGGV